MVRIRGIFLTTALVGAGLAGASPAHAGDKVLVAAVPAWVAPVPPDAATADSTLPRFDEQVRIEGDHLTAYVDVSRKITSAEVLTQSGTLSVNWSPDHGDLIWHTLTIERGGKTINALKSGGDFSVLRREARLEHLAIDGQLTAVKHIEGLQIGDVLHTAFSITARDAVLGGNVQDALILIPAPAKLAFGRARIIWPTAQAVKWKPLSSGATPVVKPLDGQWTELSVALPTPKLPETPKNAPSRFTPVPMLQFSSFTDWSAVARVMAPLYAVKGKVPAASPLAARIDAIAAKSADPRERLAEGLRMVQDEVRYQLIALGTGNYVPQTPLDTWTKRYGDCKAKTLLLLAVLDRLGISAEPVLANLERGDGVVDRLPAAGAFDHVFVHAMAAGRDYWLDGTALGSRRADLDDVPHYGWVLPVRAEGAALLRLPDRAHARYDLDVDVAYDQTGGPHLPSPFHMVMRFAGSSGEREKVEQGPDYDEKLSKYAAKVAKTWTGSDTIAKPHAEWDEEAAVWTLSVDGVAYPDWRWRDGHYQYDDAPDLRVTLDAPRDRAAWRAIPALIEQPWSAHFHAVTRLGTVARGASLVGGDPVDLDLSAAHWQRRISFADGTLVDDVVSRETGAEIAADAISRTAHTISETMERTPHLVLPDSYPKRWRDARTMRDSAAMQAVRKVLDARVAEKPDEADRLTDRAWFAERLFDWAAAEADYTRAIAVDANAGRYLSRAKLRALRGDHAGALADAQAAYDLEQGNTSARNRLAVELAEAGKLDAALDLLPASPDPGTDQGLSDLLERVSVLETGGQHDDALALLDGALRRRGSSAELHNARCWYQALRNRALDAALADCNKAIELSSDPAGYLDSRAMVQFRAGHFDAALADYAAALASEPEQSASLWMSAVVHAQKGDKAAGLAALEAARTLDPDIDRFYARFGIKY